MSATVSPDTVDTSVTWRSSNTNVATVNSSGLVTAIANGSATITAVSNYNTTKQATCLVTVSGFTQQIINYMNRISFEDNEISAALVANNSTTNIVANNANTVITSYSIHYTKLYEERIL